MNLAHKVIPEKTSGPKTLSVAEKFHLAKRDSAPGPQDYLRVTLAYLTIDGYLEVGEGEEPLRVTEKGREKKEHLAPYEQACLALIEGKQYAQLGSVFKNLNFDKALVAGNFMREEPSTGCTFCWGQTRGPNRLVLTENGQLARDELEARINDSVELFWNATAFTDEQALHYYINNDVQSGDFVQPRYKEIAEAVDSCMRLTCQ